MYLDHTQFTTDCIVTTGEESNIYKITIEEERERTIKTPAEIDKK